MQHLEMIGRSCCWLSVFDYGIGCIVNFQNDYQQGTLTKLMRLCVCSFYADFDGATDYFYCAFGICSYYLVDLNEYLAYFYLDMIFHFLNL